MPKLSRRARRDLYREASRATRANVPSLEKRLDRPLSGYHFKTESRMSWGFAALFDVERKCFTQFEMPGSIEVKPRTPNHYATVRTDTTDRVSRNSTSWAKKKEW